MQIEPLLRDSFPPLGFVGVAERDTVRLEHGPHVEVRPDRFSDGAWAGDFGEPVDPDAFHAGTGGTVTDQRLVLWSSSGLIDRLFVFDDGAGRTTFANSLPLLLLALDDVLDPADLAHRSRTATLDLGLDVAPRRFRTTGGRVIRHLADEVAVVTARGLEVRRRRAPEAPQDFATYRELLRHTVALVLGNAVDARRAHPLRPLPTISAGYDSTAVAVLAAEAGCCQALTMLRRDSDGNLVDHPGQVAEVLGLDLIEVERDRWRDGPVVESALLAAASVSFMDVAVLTYGDLLDGTLLLTGYIGDNMWDPRNFRVSTDLAQGFGAVSGRGLAEHRLAHGYAVFQIPSIAQPAQPAIARINRSPDMRPWDIGGSYNRPIARRIAEEAGIPRGSFAVRKYAGGGRVGSSRARYTGRTEAERQAELVEVMPPDAAAAYLAHAQQHAPTAARLRLALRLAPIGCWLLQRIDGVNARVGRRWSGRGIRGIVPRRVVSILAARLRICPDHTYLLAHWGTAVLMEQYRPAPNEGDDPAGTISPP